MNIEISPLSKSNSDNLIFYFLVLTFFLLPMGTAPPLISFGFATLIWLFSGKVSQVKSIIQKKWFYPVLLFISLPWIGLAYSQNIELGLEYALKTKYWIAAFIVAGVIFTEDRIKNLLRYFWTGLFLGAFLAFFQLIGVITPFDEAHLGFGIVHTLISMYLMIGILTVTFHYKKFELKKDKIICLFLLGVFLFHLAILRSRSSYLIFCFVSPIIANNLMHNFSKVKKSAVCFFLVFALLFSPIVQEEIVGTYLSLDAKKESILKGEYVPEFPRFYIVKEAILIIKEYPLLGIGTGSIAEATRSKGHIVNHPHNNFLYMGTSFGVLGIISCFWLFGGMFVRSWKSRETSLGNFVFSSCLVLFLAGIFDTPLLNTGTLLLLSLNYGMMNSFVSNQKIEV